MDIKKLQALVIDALEDVKAQDIRIYDTTHLTSMFDSIVVASGTSNRQTKALAASVRDKVKAAGGDIVSMEGENTGEWVLVDLGDMVVHIMQPAIRAYYRLEELWGDKEIRLAEAKGSKETRRAGAKKATKPSMAESGQASAAQSSKSGSKRPVKAASKVAAAKTAKKNAAKTAAKTAAKSAAKSGTATAGKSPAKSTGKSAVKKTVKTAAKKATKHSAPKRAATKG